jgi:hypothetical protein
MLHLHAPPHADAPALRARWALKTTTATGRRHDRSDGNGPMTLFALPGSLQQGARNARYIRI